MIKKRITALSISVVLCLGAVAAYADDDVRVYVNGERAGDRVILSDDRTYIPLRAVAEAMGAEVVWDEASRSVFVSFTEDDAVSKIVETVSPSVVAIVGNYTGTSGEAAKYNNSTAHGTGVIYKSNGYIVTNAHVVDEIINTTVVLHDGSSFAGEVLFSDKTADLAIVKINKIGLKPITMANKEDIVSGRTAIAIGTPISLSMRNTVTKGIVSGSAVSTDGSYYKLIQTDAAINPGNSGGPLLNSKGELIGINSSGYVGWGIENISFAIPVDTVKYAIAQYEANGRIIRPEFNITLEQSWEADIGLPTNKGITVKASSNPALITGDVISAVNGIAVHSIIDWNEALKDSYNGSSVKVTYMRGGETAEAEIYG